MSETAINGIRKEPVPDRPSGTPAYDRMITDLLAENSDQYFQKSVYLYAKKLLRALQTKHKVK